MSHRLFPVLLRLLPLLAGFCLLAGTGAAQTDISGVVYDGNGGPLLAGQVYHATNTVTVPTGQTLTVQPGAIVKFYVGAYRLDVYGTLLVAGTTADPVHITSILDDTVGGDSMGDGPTVGAPGDWYGVYLRATADASNINHAVVRFAGRAGYPGIYSVGADCTLTDTTIRECASDGIDLGSSVAFPTITDCALEDNGGRAIDNVRMDQVPGIANNTATGNAGGDYMYLSVPTPQGDLTVGAENCLNGALVVGENCTVAVAITLTLDPGVVLKWVAGAYRMDVYGTLVSQGTLADPVVLTSFADDDFGGDTNGDGASNGVPGDWYGVFLRATADLTTIEHTVVRHAGRAGYAGVVVNGADVSMVDSTVRDCLAAGMDLTSTAASPTVSHCAFHDNGGTAIDKVRMDHVPGISHNTAWGNGGGDYMFLSVPTPVGDVAVYEENCLNGALVVSNTCTVAVTDTMTLHPGVVLKWVSGAYRLDVLGTVLARGSAAKPVVLTSLADDDWAGDTNGDGPSAGTPGDWYGVFLRPTADATVLDRTVLRYAGRASYAGVYANGADFTMTNALVNNCLVDGIDLTATASMPSVSHCTITGNGGVAIDGVRMDQVPGFFSNAAADNTLGDYLRVTVPSPLGDVTVERRNCLNGALVLDATCSVASGRTLTLGRGVVLKFEVGAIRLDVYGSLVCEGTAFAPVVLTSLTDDEWAGDTNNDGAATAGLAGDWYGVLMRASADPSRMENAAIRFAGRAGYAGIDNDSPLLTLRAVRCEYGGASGFRMSAHSGAAVNLVAFENIQSGIEADGGSFDVVHATLAQNGGYGLEAAVSHTGKVYNTIAWGNLTDNFAGYGAGELVNCDGSPVLAGTNGCIYADPLFVDASPAVGDLRLGLASPCVDTASYAVGLAVEKDADENSRLLDPRWTGTALPDMGAFEHSLWALEVRGVPVAGMRQTFRTAGPMGTSRFLLGFLDGTTFADPYGFSLAGDVSLVDLGTVPVTVPMTLDIPRLIALLGVEYGVQALCIPNSDLAKGGMTNLYRAKILELADKPAWQTGW